MGQLREKGRSSAAYARAVERHWARSVGRAIVLSPRDFALLQDWHSRGIPLALVQEVLSERLKRRSRGTPLRLSALQLSVEQSWSVICGGRLVGPGVPRDDEAVPQDTPLARWRRRAEREGSDTPLGRLLSELLERLRLGADPAAIEAELERALPGSIDPERLERLHAELRAELAPYRSRMSEEQLAITISRACSNRLRSELDLPGL